MGFGAASMKEDMDKMMRRRLRSSSFSKSRKRDVEPVPNITEIYGFAIFSFTIVSYIIFILWTFIPEETLIYMGVTYYPGKYWAIALPSFLIFCGILGLLTYVSVNLIITPALDSFSTFTDNFARKPRDPSQRGNLDTKGKVPPVSDLPLSVVNRLFFSSHAPKRRSRISTSTMAWRERYRRAKSTKS